jgi:cation:H+ antiporter
MDLLILLVSFVVIVAGAELFTNGIEWFGRKAGLGEGAVGSVLAAIGTALPETMIPIVAILFSAQAHSDEIGVGAILGAPFMLATLAMAVTGLVVLSAARRRAAGTDIVVQTHVVAHDIRSFVIAYGFALLLALLPTDAVLPRVAGAIALVVGYGWYARRHLIEAPSDDAEAEELRPLRFHGLAPGSHRLDGHDPHVRLVVLQVIAAAFLILIGAQIFVGAVEGIGASLGMDELLLALLVAPIATELPEAVNAVIWIRQGKDTLAIGNITGAMVFQATIPTAIALAFAPEGWSIQGHNLIAFASAAVAFASVAVIGIPMLARGRLGVRSLLLGGVLYVGYVAFVLSVALRPA